MFRLLLNGNGLACLVKLHHAERPGIFHPVAEYRRAALQFRRFFQCAFQRQGVKDIVAQHQTDPIISRETLSDAQSVGDAARHRLYGVIDVQAELTAIA